MSQYISFRVTGKKGKGKDISHQRARHIQDSVAKILHNHGLFGIGLGSDDRDWLVNGYVYGPLSPTVVANVSRFLHEEEKVDYFQFNMTVTPGDEKFMRATGLI